MFGFGWLAELKDRLDTVEKMVLLVRAHEETLAAWAPDRVIALAVAKKCNKAGTTKDIVVDAEVVLEFLEARDV